MTGSRRLRKPGFNIIELMIAVSIFGLLSIILVQTFTSFNRLNRRVANTAVLSQDARFAMELLVREARNNRIDYTISPLPAQSESLELLDPEGNLELIAKRTDAATCGTAVTACLAISIDGGVTWNPITSKFVEVTKFQVRVRPDSDPLSPGSVVNIQPFVTVSLGLRYNDPNPAARVELETQTSVSSRVYER